VKDKKAKDIKEQKELKDVLREQKEFKEKELKERKELLQASKALIPVKAKPAPQPPAPLHPSLSPSSVVDYSGSFTSFSQLFTPTLPTNITLVDIQKEMCGIMTSHIQKLAYQPPPFFPFPDYTQCTGVIMHAQKVNLDIKYYIERHNIMLQKMQGSFGDEDSFFRVVKNRSEVYGTRIT